MSTIDTYKAWLTNPPDYYDSRNQAEELAALKKQIILLKRKIERVDEETLAASGNPRSNETRIARNKATEQLKDELAELQGEHDRLETLINFSNLHKAMSATASYMLNYVMKTGETL